MWSLLERGKELAANIDKQLNESVGLEKTQRKSADTGALDDAWNDDFEDDELFDTSNIKEKPAATFTGINTEKNISDWDDGVNLNHEYTTSVNDRSSPIIPAESVSSVITTNLPVVDKVDSSKVSEKIKSSAEIRDGSPEKLVLRAEKTPIRDSLNSESSCHVINQTAVATTDIAKNPYINDAESEVILLSTHSAENTQQEKTEQPEEKVVPVEALVVKDESTLEVSTIKVDQDPGWENDLYEDEDDEDDDEEENEEDDYEDDRANQSPALEKAVFVDTVDSEKKCERIETPPVTITIPSADDAATEERFRVQEEEHELALLTLKTQLHQLESQLQQRENEITQKVEQMTSMITIHESEKEDLQSKIIQTKEEAKRRIQKAKEHVETLEATMSGKEDLAAKDSTIAALREEGQKLAIKQSEMSQAVRAAKGETRELKFKLEEEVEKREKALGKVSLLESELKKTKEELSSARKGEAKAIKLENDLVSLKEEANRKESSNMSLQQHVKELKAENKDLVKELESTQKGALIESKRESNKLRKEHGDILSEMEVKLRSSERDASVREDALRQELDELRRRWQDSVRRADTLSMDVQNSTAPLLRQLESMERQSRVRAAAWAELETKLRTDLEDNIIENEKLTKERNEFKSNLNRISRVSKDREEDLTMSKNLIEDQRVKIEKQETQIAEMESEARRRKEEYSEVERLANEGISKVRSDMMKTVIESEERYQGQLKVIENELAKEREKKSLLEQQVEELLESSGMMVVPTPTATSTPARISSTVKKLRSAEGQADILAGAISSLEEVTEEAHEDAFINEDQPQSTLSSFAAMEQLSQRLKESKVELDTLRTSLTSSEKVRASLVEELSETRVAKEKLPLFQAKVQELANANMEKDREIITLKEDISEVRDLYRGQLNSLLEEKAAKLCEDSEKVQGKDSTEQKLPTKDH